MVAYCFATLNHSPLVGADVDILRQIDAAAASGFDSLELDIFSLRQWTERGGSLADVARRINDRGLRCFALAGLNVFDAEPQSRAEADDVGRMCDALVPDWLLVRIAGERANGIRFLKEHAADFGPSRLGFEPSPFTVLRTIGDASAAIDEVGTGAVIVDAWHFFATGADWDALAALPDDRFAYVQLDDALTPSANLQHDTMHRRALPGEGLLDLARFADALRARHFDGVYSMEVMSDTWRAQPVEAFTDACRKSLHPLF